MFVIQLLSLYVRITDAQLFFQDDIKNRLANGKIYKWNRLIKSKI